MITISSNHARKLFSIVLTVAAFAALPAVASAQTIDPTSDQYNNTLQQVSAGQDASTCEDAAPGSAAAAECAPPPSSCEERAANGSGEVCAPSATPEAGGLPFTGLDVAALAAVAGFLLLAGIGLRRARFGERTQA